eukprot:403346890
MHKYRLISKKGEGTFSEVLKAQSIKTGKYVAIKCMKAHFYDIDQVNKLREIQALKRLSPHPNIITLHEVLYDEPTGRLALVFELMDMNMYEAIKGRRNYLPEQRVKFYMYQVLKSIDHMHKNGIYHRDIKPENILIKDDQVKLADFGSCRGVYSQPPFTEYISTRWYRPPECLLTDGYYNHKMDYWGIGCVFFEMLALFPLFPGNNELDQVHKIHNILGTPSQDVLEKFQKQASHMEFNFPKKEGTGIAKLIPHVQPDVQDVIIKLLAYNADSRMTASQALKHICFKEHREADKSLNEPGPQNPPSQMGIMGLTQRGNESMSQKAQSMTKFPSDNMSDSKYVQQDNKKPSMDKYKTNKGNTNMLGQASGTLADLKIENSKNQTFNSDFEDSTSVQGANIVNGIQQLPPIFMGNKKGQKKKNSNVPPHPHQIISQVANPLTQLNQTKKNFPVLNKITNHKKSYVSPYSLKAIHKQ